MGTDQNGGPSTHLASEGRNVFALVIYIPGQLGRFLDDLRRELVPHYNPHAHVSVLPPRPLCVEWPEASEHARTVMESFAPFDVELTRLEIFPVTEVIYLEVGGGSEYLHQMHDAMNSSELKCKEPFPYHPHITLAQEIPHDEGPAKHELATRRWKEYSGSRSFRAESAVFVRNTVSDCWIDLAEYSFSAVPVKSR